MQSKTLSQWQTYQRLHAKTLSDRQIELLDSIRYKDVTGVREHEEKGWNETYEKIRKIGIGSACAKPMEPSLSSWLSRQKRKEHEGKLPPEKKRRLEEAGVDFSSYKGGKASTTKKEEWYRNFEELKRYRQSFGHCNVPNRYAPNRPLGSWVSNQRTRYKCFKESELSLDVFWVHELETVGFEWTRKTQTSTKRSRHGGNKTHATAAPSNRRQVDQLSQHTV